MIELYLYSPNYSKKNKYLFAENDLILNRKDSEYNNKINEILYLVDIFDKPTTTYNNDDYTLIVKYLKSFGFLIELSSEKLDTDMAYAKIIIIGKFISNQIFSELSYRNINTLIDKVIKYININSQKLELPLIVNTTIIKSYLNKIFEAEFEHISINFLTKVIISIILFPAVFSMIEYFIKSVIDVSVYVFIVSVIQFFIFIVIIDRKLFKNLVRSFNFLFEKLFYFAK